MLYVIFVARCLIEAKAFGFVNDDVNSTAYVKLNGVVVWEATSLMIDRYGVNVMVVEPNCTLRQRLFQMHNFRNFDTHGRIDSAAQLRDFLNGFEDGTVLLGVTCNSSARYLSDAHATLRNMGVDVADMQDQGAVVFKAVKGDPSKTVFGYKRLPGLLQPHILTYGMYVCVCVLTLAGAVCISITNNHQAVRLRDARSLTCLLTCSLAYLLTHSLTYLQTRYGRHIDTVVAQYGHENV